MWVRTVAGAFLVPSPGDWSGACAFPFPFNPMLASIVRQAFCSWDGVFAAARRGHT